MHWTIARSLAMSCEDVTYEEWCAMFVSYRRPEHTQITSACQTAHPILVRNNVIEPSVTFDQTIRECDHA